MGILCMKVAQLLILIAFISTSISDSFIRIKFAFVFSTTNLICLPLTVGLRTNSFILYNFMGLG